MKNRLPLRPPIEEQHVSDEVLNRLASSTHSPSNAFSKENGCIILSKNMETTKANSSVKLILPFPHVLWMLGNTPDTFEEELAFQESRTEQENIPQSDEIQEYNRENR